MKQALLINKERIKMTKATLDSQEMVTGSKNNKELSLLIKKTKDYANLLNGNIGSMSNESSMKAVEYLSEAVTRLKETIILLDQN